jgi:predicted RNA binding protein YcfA (HicA-like mRNA interferase family)
MGRREKLLAKMRGGAAGIRFAEIDALLRYEGFVLFNTRGSHCTYHHADGRMLTIVRPMVAARPATRRIFANY